MGLINFFQNFFCYLICIIQNKFYFYGVIYSIHQKTRTMKTTTNFKANEFYALTMAAVFQLIDQGDLSSVNEVEDYLLSEAQSYVEKATEQVITETLPDDLRELNEEFGEITSKKGLAWCSLVLWMQNNNMVHDALKHFAKKHNY